MEQKDNSGALFKNKDKKSDNHPDYKGQALIDGTEYWLDSWINKSKAGDTYMSVKFKPKDEQTKKQGSPAARAEPVQDFDDDIPF